MTTAITQTTFICLTAMFMVSCAMMPSTKQPLQESTIWNVDNLTQIGGTAVTVIGNPKVIEKIEEYLKTCRTESYHYPTL